MSVNGDGQGSNTNNLDISNIENSDLDKLASSIETFYKSDSNVKTSLSWSWERNQLMLDGRQWLVYDSTGASGGQWRPLKVAKANEYIPRPVTNYIFDIYQVLKSYLIKNKPRSTVYPNTQTFKDKMAAKIATLCIEANWERLREQENYEFAAATGITYGTVFKKDYWDTSSIQTAKIPRTEPRPITDPMTGQVVGMEDAPVVDPITGDVQYDQVSLGDVNSEVIEPYRIALDPLANDLHKARWIMEYSIQRLDWVKEVYGQEGNGYTGKAVDLKPERNLNNSLRKFYNLKNSSGTRQGTGILEGTSNSGDEMLENAVVLKEYYERPSQKHPKGRLVVVAGGLTLYAADSPYEGPELNDWHPYSEFRWEVVPGRFWGKAPLDDAIEIQKQINSIDSVIILTRKTMAIPQKLIPYGAGIAPGSWNGRPGLEVFYRETGGSKPETIPPQGVDEQVFAERSQRLEDLKNITGALDILRGDKPPGVTAASALNLLYEVGTGKIYPALDRWKRFIESSQKKQLRLINKFYKEPREDYIKLIRQKNKELSEEAISQFIGSDLYDNCNVTVEAGSNLPKLQAAKQAQLLELAQTGSLQLESPANRVEFLRQMGVMGFDSDVGPDTKRAEWENDILDSLEYSQDNQAVVLDIDEHAIHIEVHKRRMKEPSFMSLPIQVQQAYMQHIQQHEDMQAQKQQMEMINQMSMGMPPQEGAQPGSPQPIESAGKGISTRMSDALRSDALAPGDIKS